MAGGAIKDAPRMADPDQVEPLGQPCEADVRSRYSESGAPELAFAGFDRLPSLFERREIPSAAATAHDPEPAPLAIEGEATADRELLDHLVRAECRVAKETGRVHPYTRRRAL